MGIVRGTRARPGARWLVVAVVAALVLGLAGPEPVGATRGGRAHDKPKPRSLELSSPPLRKPKLSIPKAPAVVPKPFDPRLPAVAKRTVKDLPKLGPEQVGKRDAVTEVFVNADGTETVKVHAEPVHYRPAGAKRWEKIDNSLVPDPQRPGWVRNKANAWTVRFGPVGAGGTGGVELTTAKGTSRWAPELPAGASPVEPVVAGRGDEATITYPAVWPGVDVVYSVSSVRVKEKIVVSDGTKATFPFVVDGLGLTPGAPAKPGAAAVPAPKVTGTQAGGVRFDPLSASDESGRPDAKAKVRARIETVAASAPQRQRMTVSVDKTWLRSAAADGLAVIDPSATPNPTQACSYAIDSVGNEGSLGCSGVDTGVAFPGTNSYARGVASWNYWPYVATNDVLFAGVFMNEDQQQSVVDPEVVNLWDALNWSGAGAVAGNGDPARLIDAAISDRRAALASLIFDMTDAMHWWQVDGHFGDPPSPPNQNHLFGFSGDEDAADFGQRLTWKAYPTANMFLVLNLNARVPAPTLTAPKDGSLVIDSMTPTLRWNPVTDPDGDPVKYTVSVSTAADGASGFVATSPELTTTEWQVPAGVLRDGQSYFWKVQANDTHSWTPSTVWRLTVDKRQGAAGLSPTDSFGGVTTNLVTGTPSITVAAPDMPSVGGGVGVDVMYNGRSPVTGLVGTYREDADKDAVVDPTDPVKLVRTDSQVSFDWAQGSPSPAVPVDSFLANWSGIVQLPAGNWEFGVRADDGARVWIDGAKKVDRWGTLTPDPVFQGGGVPGGSRRRIQVDYYEVTSTAYIELWVRNTADPSQQFIVPADWLSPAAPDMAPGWTLQAADANASYLRANVSEGSVALAQSDGTVATFIKRSDGSYKPPEDVDDLLAVNGDGTVAVHDDAGLDYVFNPDGGLASVSSALDDRNPAAALTHYDGQGRLEWMKDPVSGRQVTLRYAASDGDTACPHNLGSAGQYQAETGLLCQVSYWDGTSTDLYYFTDTDLLAAVVNPGTSVTGFSYDSAGRVVSMVSPLARDALSSGARTDADIGRLSTVIAYASADPNAKVTSVTLPAALQADQLRAKHNYTYAQQTDGGVLTSGTATVTRAGVAGPYRTVKYDHRGRPVEDTDAAGLTTKTYWDARDLVYATETPDGQVTSTYYNARKQPTDVWGPAPKAWFDFVWYFYDLAVAKSDFQSQMAHAVTRYDEGITGTQAMWWNNPDFGGAPKAHNNDPGELADSDSSGRPAGVAADGVSARYTGDITFPTQGLYQMQVCAGPFDAAWLYIDDKLISSTSFWDVGGNLDVNTCSNIEAEAAKFKTYGPNEKHQLRVDYKDFGNPDLLHLNWIGPGIAYSHVAGTALTAGYNLPTTTVDPDGKTTTTEYTDAATGIGPQHGLVTRTTIDPGGLNLSETNTYEPAGATDKYLRKLSHTLPAGAATQTTSTYYGNTEQVDNPCTTASDPANQGGRLKLDTAADPDGAGGQAALRRESVYDASGRTVATHVGTEPWTCTTYDARGRATKVEYPPFGDQPATRTVTTNYSADPDGSGPRVASPLVTTVTDPAGTIQTETDLLGRVVSYTDVWGNTTTFTYDQAGRETGNSGPVGTIVKGYDNADKVKTVSRNGQPLASVAYDTATGRMTSASYPSGSGNAGNGTTGTFSYDGVGRPSGVTWTGPGGALLTKDEVTRSLGGDVVDQKTDGNDHHPGADYVYDKAGRLVEAFTPAPAGVASRHVCYEFGTTTPNGCGAATVGAVAAGKNTNRTRQIIQDGATTSYSYDNADRLTSTTEAAVGTPAYDAHGNTTTISGETHTYDAADRHLSTTKGATTVSYVRDATDRIVARKVGSTVVARYGSTGSGDAADFTTDTSNVVQEVTYSLPGGALLTTRAAGAGGNVWSYPNLHGDVAAVANQSGAKQGVTRCYDPYGNNLAGGIPDNSLGNFDYGWLGKHQRPLESETTLQPIIEMGARQYSPLLGRFIEVDPVDGGSANDYDYVNGDPVNAFDLAGTCKTHHGHSPWGYVRSARCRASHGVTHMQNGARSAHGWALRNFSATGIRHAWNSTRGWRGAIWRGLGRCAVGAGKGVLIGAGAMGGGIGGSAVAAGYGLTRTSSIVGGMAYGAGATGWAGWAGIAAVGCVGGMTGRW